MEKWDKNVAVQVPAVLGSCEDVYCERVFQKSSLRALK